MKIMIYTNKELIAFLDVECSNILKDILVI